jgi:hypothetical protein
MVAEKQKREREWRGQGPNSLFKDIPQWPSIISPIAQRFHQRLGTKPSAHGPLGTFKIQTIAAAVDGVRDQILGSWSLNS